MKNISINTLFIAIISLFSLFASTACAQIGAQAAETVSFSGIPASFTIPAGWKLAQREGDYVAIVPNTTSPEVVVVVRAGIYQDTDAFYTLAAKSLREDLNVQNAQILQAPRALQVNGMNASSALVAASNQNGELIKIGLNVVISANGVGLGVVALAPAAKYQQGQAAVETVLQSARFGTMTSDRRAAAAITGRWVKVGAANSGNRNGASGGWSSGSNVYYTFYEDGTYSYLYESFASVDVPGAGALSSSRDEDTGRYYVANGQITLVGNKNGSNSLVFRVVDNKYLQIGNGYFARQ